MASPLAQLAIKGGLPGSAGALVSAVARAEVRGREFIAEAAIVNPVNRQGPTAEFARSYAAFEAEVSALVSASAELDERWLLSWERRPSWADAHLLEPPFSRGRLDVLVRYMAQKNRQLGWMIEFLRGGSDRPIRRIHYWLKHDAEEPSATARNDAFA